MQQQVQKHEDELAARHEEAEAADQDVRHLLSQIQEYQVSLGSKTLHQLPDRGAGCKRLVQPLDPEYKVRIQTQICL